MEDSRHRGYVPHVEFGVFVWYKTTKTTSAGITKDGRPIRTGIRSDRVCTTATHIDEAVKQLDHYLVKLKANKQVTPQYKPDPDQQKLF